MLEERIGELEKELAEQGSELREELEALKAIAQELAEEKLSPEHLRKISLKSFEALLQDLIAQKEFTLLTYLQKMALGKEKTKRLNKTIHQLKSRGIEIPEKSLNQKIIFSGWVIKEWAQVSPVMFLTGEQLFFYFASGTMGSNLLICELNPEDGFKQVEILDLNEKEAKQKIANSQIGTTKMPVIEVSREHFFWRIKSAEAKTSSYERKKEWHYFLKKFGFKELGPIDGEAPVLKELERERIESRPVLNYQLTQLLEHIFFQFWSFDMETLKTCEEELKDAQLSPIQLTEEQWWERIKDILEKNSENGLRKNQSRIKDGLLENAYLLNLIGEKELAEVAVKIALNLNNKYETGEFARRILLRSFPSLQRFQEKLGSNLIIPTR